MPCEALALAWPSQVASNSWNLYSGIAHFMGTNCSQEEGVAFSKAAFVGKGLFLKKSLAVNCQYQHFLGMN